MDDLISRQAAIDAMTNILWHYPNECYRNLNEYEFAKGLAELGLKSVPSAQQWIPCSERLPNHDECIKNNRLFNVSDGNRSYSEYFDYDKQKFGEDTMAGFRVDYAVIAWMPLPEAPEAPEVEEMTYLEAYRQCKTVEAIKVMVTKDTMVAIFMGNNPDRIKAIKDAMNQAIAEREEE